MLGAGRRQLMLTDAVSSSGWGGGGGVLRKVCCVVDYAHPPPQHDTLQSCWNTFSRIRGKTLSSLFYCPHCMTLDTDEWFIYV